MGVIALRSWRVQGRERTSGRQSSVAGHCAIGALVPSLLLLHLLSVVVQSLELSF